MPNKVGYVLATQGLLTDVDTVQRNVLGIEVEDESGGLYCYLQGVASQAAGDWVIYNSTTYLTVRLVTAIAAGPVAVAMSAVLLGQFGWYQIGGQVLVANIATVAFTAGVALYASAVAGRATSTPAAGTAIFGAALTAASVANVGSAFMAINPFTMASSTL